MWNINGGLPHRLRGPWDLVGARSVQGTKGLGLSLQVAPDVTSLKVGDRVSIPGCGRCEYCATGRETSAVALKMRVTPLMGYGQCV